MKKNNDFGVNVGSSSLLLIFVILCLVSFATLSIVSANADHNLTDKVQERSASYYSACNDAQIRLSNIDSALLEAYETSRDRDEYTAAAGGENITFAIPVSDIQTLSVTLQVLYPANPGDAFYKITEWKLETTGTLEFDDTLPLLL